jgi:hypothetical protein
MAEYTCWASGRLSPRTQQRVFFDRGEHLTTMLYLGLQPVPHVLALIGPTFTGPETTGFIAWNTYDWEIR